MGMRWRKKWELGTSVVWAVGGAAGDRWVSISEATDPLAEYK